MNANLYQLAVARTMRPFDNLTVTPAQLAMIDYLSLRADSACGDLDEAKKHVFHGHPLSSLRELAGDFERATQVATPKQLALLNYSMGMAGEGGEALDVVRQHLFEGMPLDREKLVKEIGDQLWYAAALARELGVELSNVMEANVAKLTKRYPTGFSEADSLARRDVAEASPCSAP